MTSKKGKGVKPVSAVLAEVPAMSRKRMPLLMSEVTTVTAVNEVKPPATAVLLLVLAMGRKRASLLMSKVMTDNGVMLVTTGDKNWRKQSPHPTGRPVDQTK
jgi:hypothetical protein